MTRKIIHLDMDAFFAAVEQLDRPELRGKPVIVGGDPESRGVVATCSYEARPYGIHSAMSAAKAKRLCPEAIFLRPRFSRYSEISQHVRQIFLSVTDLVEPLSLDEAYLDVTQNKLDLKLAKDVALQVKEEIKRQTGLTASAGVAPNKFVAKIASDIKKPDGLVVVPPSKVLSFLAPLPVEKLWGVGPVTAKHLHRMGLHKISDLRNRSEQELLQEFGQFGNFLYALAEGRDERRVETDYETKSSGTETTFAKDILDKKVLQQVLHEQTTEVAQALEKLERGGRTTTLKVRYDDFSTITRSWTQDRLMQKDRDIYQAALALLNKTEAGSRPVRLLGVSVSGLLPPNLPQQLWLEWPQ